VGEYACRYIKHGDLISQHFNEEDESNYLTNQRINLLRVPFYKYNLPESVNNSNRIFRMFLLLLHIHNIKSPDKTLVHNNQQNVLYFVFFMITKYFGLNKKPSSGNFLVTQNIKKELLFVATDPLCYKEIT
jgi:hypothetical protein